jgi:hypothetical protein
VAVAAIMVVALLLGAGIAFTGLLVMLAQLYFTRKAVFSPKTALGLLKLKL